MKNLDELTKSWTPDEKRLAKPEVQSGMTQAKNILGYPGRMMSGSKSGYANAFPSHVPVFNANVCTQNLGKIWYGDLDLSLDGKQLQELAKALGEPVLVLREMAARFDHENQPQLDRYVASFTAEGVEVGPSLMSMDKQPMAEVCKRGKLAGQLVYKKEFRR